MIIMKKKLSLLLALVMIASMFNFNVFATEEISAEGEENEIVTIPVEPGLFVNWARTYQSSAYTANQYTAYSSINAISSTEFKSRENLWTTPWTDEMQDNVLVHNGNKYKLRVVDGISNHVIFRGSEATSTKVVDVENGKYEAITFLGGLDQNYSYNTTLLAVLVFEDGTEEVIESSELSKLDANKEGSLQVYRANPADGTVMTDRKYYLHQYDLVIKNSEKVLDKIKLLGTRAVVTDDGDGTYTITNPTTGDQIHRADVYAMSLVSVKRKSCSK